MKKLILIFCFAFITSTSFAQLLSDNFNYQAGDSLTQHGWTAFSGSGFALFVTSPGLTFPGYPGSGVGNATTLTLTSSSAQDVSKPFTSNISSGSVYASFMVKVDTATSVGNYFASFLPSNSISNYFGRVYARIADNGNVAFGISKSSTNATILASYSDSIYAKGTTYVVVVKYKFNTGTTSDDEVSLFVFSGALPLTEPSPTVGPVSTTQSDVSPDLGKFALRQGASGSSLTPGATVDGIRVTGAWNPSIWNIKLAVQGLYNSGSGTLNISDTVIVYLRNGSSPFNVVDSAVSVVDSASLTGNFEFDNAPDGNYYFDVVYRKSPQFRNGIATWSKNGGENITRAGGNYDFTSAASQAYGNNQQLNAGVYTIYNGDTDQDGIVDLTDLISTLNSASVFTSGYVNTDVNGDDQVNLSDVLIVYNNASIFVSSVTPL
ncbi:MAG TPA: hypothetical protein PKA90_15825 [Ignavibacteria bacterium]|nr:hypothetical protein [Ignavibacteria bacterium]HMR41887.1 hypothetical protein [Ignavibacteria bacterium]